MGNKCGECMYLDFGKSNQSGFFTYYWCKGFGEWRREGAGACGAFTERGGCYLTSACVGYMGLADDCEELTLLREFRDGYLKSSDGGEKLIKEYYEIAPYLVEKINKNERKNEIYEYIYRQICICVDLIKNSDLEKVTKIYTDMTQNVKNMVT